MVEQLQKVRHQLLAEFCRRNHIRKLAVFGSALGEDFRADSDLDLLVEFQPGRVPGLAFFGLQQELSEMFGRSVDLNTPNSLPVAFRDQIRAMAEVLYAAP